MGFFSVIGVLSFLGLLSRRNETVIHYVEPPQKKTKPEYVESKEDGERYLSICDTVISLLPKTFGIRLGDGDILHNGKVVAWVPYKFIRLNNDSLDDEILKFVENLVQKYN